MQKKEKIKISTINHEGMNLVGYANKKGLDVFYFNRQLKIDCPNFKFIGPGDHVEITYTGGDGQPKEIINIEKWSVNDMRNKIIKIIKDAIDLSEKTRGEYAEVCNKYSLTEEGKADERKKAINKIAGEMARKTEEGLQLFDKRIEEICQEEQTELNRKNASLEYQNMIVEKATVLEMIADIKELPPEYLKQYLQEFANDPIAILVMQSSVKGTGLEVIASLPQNNLGLRQEALRNAKAEFEEIIKNLSVIDDVNDLAKRTLAESFVNYMECQNDDFSLHIEEVWDKMNARGNNGKSRFAFNFNRKR